MREIIPDGAEDILLSFADLLWYYNSEYVYYLAAVIPVYLDTALRIACEMILEREGLYVF